MLYLVNESMKDIGAGTAGLVALLGYAVVFFGLILLMIVIGIVGKIMASKSKAAQPAKQEVAAAPAVKASVPEAKGTAGELKLHDVSDRDAAILMAIVAHKLQKPLNTLRFKSIKEVK